MARKICNYCTQLSCQIVFIYVILLHLGKFDSFTLRSSQKQLGLRARRTLRVQSDYNIIRCENVCNVARRQLIIFANFRSGTEGHTGTNVALLLFPQRILRVKIKNRFHDLRDRGHTHQKRHLGVRDLGMSAKDCTFPLQRPSKGLPNRICVSPVYVFCSLPSTKP